jgi:hypothetical protein
MNKIILLFCLFGACICFTRNMAGESDTQNHAELIERLKDSKEANMYLMATLKKCKKLDKKDANKLLQKALKNIAEARPNDVNIDVDNESSFKMKSLLRLLQLVSQKIM